MIYDSVENASTDLQAILGRISKNLTDQEKEAIQEELAQYMKAIPAGKSEFSEYDRIADETYEQLLRQLTKSALDQLRANRRFLVLQTTSIKAITTRAEASRQRFELDMLQHISRLANGALGAADAVKDAIQAHDLPAAEEKINTLIKMIRKFNEPLGDDDGTD